MTRQRLAHRSNDVELVERAGPFITELGTALDRQLLSEQRPGERMRMLRETTNRITRAANDAIHAYRRAQRAMALELEKPDADTTAVAAMRQHLSSARVDLLRALDSASRRYPWSQPANPQPHVQAAEMDQ